MVQRQRGFGQAGGAGRGLGVADHGLDRTQGALLLLAASRGKKLGQALEFFGIPHAGAGTVGFHEGYRFRRNAGRFIGPANRPLLARGQGGVNSRGTTVAGGAHPPDDGVNLVAVGFGVGQAL